MNTTLWLNSAGVAAGAWLVATAGGVVMALTLLTVGASIRRLGLMAGAVTLALPPFLAASCWLELTATWRTTIGAERAAQSMLPITALVLGLGLWPLTLFFVLGAWQRLQPALLEAEPRLRDRALAQCVLWPAARTSLGLASVLTLTLALANFTVPTLFQVRVFTEEFWIRYNTQFDLPGALVATWPLWLLPAWLGLVFRGREVVWPRESSVLPPRLLSARLGAGWLWGARFLSAMILLSSLALPLIQLMGNPRTWRELSGAIAAGGLAITNSFLASSVTALVVVGLSLAFTARGGDGAVFRWGARGRGLFRWGARALWLLFLLPGVFLSVGLIWLMNRPGLGWFYGSFGMVWLGLGLRYFAPAWSGIGAARRAEDSSLRESAILLGARAWSRFWLLTWPQSGRTILAVAYAVYLLCLWDVETLVLLQPPGGETLALRIFNLLHYGHAAQVNALCLVALGLALVPLLAGWIGRGMMAGRGRYSQQVTRRFFGYGGKCRSVLSMVTNSCRIMTRGVLIRPPEGQRPEMRQPRASEGRVPPWVHWDKMFSSPNGASRDRCCRLLHPTTAAQYELRPFRAWDFISSGSPRAAFAAALLPWAISLRTFGPKAQVTASSRTRPGEIARVSRSETQWGLELLASPRRILGIVLATTMGTLGLSLGGCSDSNAADELNTRLDSQFFSAVQVIGSRGVAPGQFNKPRSLTCDRADNLYVADITGRIQKFSPDGRFLLQWQMPQTVLGKAKGMSLDPAGNVIVVEPHYQRVNHFTGEGILVAQWGRRGTNLSDFILPRCVAVNSAGEYFLGEYTTVERVQKFSVAAELASTPQPKAATNAAYALLGAWGQPGQANGDFNRAEGIAIGPGDAVYVADSCNHRIQVFDREGRFLRTHGQAGSGPGQFSFPYDVRVEGIGRQFVCEFGNSRVSVFDANDHLVETIGRAGRAPGEFANPWAICFDSHGNLYVADSQNHRVQKLLRRPQTWAGL